MKKFFVWLGEEFLSRVVMEFIWLLFTALMAAGKATKRKEITNVSFF